MIFKRKIRVNDDIFDGLLSAVRSRLASKESDYGLDEYEPWDNREILEIVAFAIDFFVETQIKPSHSEWVKSRMTGVKKKITIEGFLGMKKVKRKINNSGNYLEGNKICWDEVHFISVPSLKRYSGFISNYDGCVCSEHLHILSCVAGFKHFTDFQHEYFLSLPIKKRKKYL